jgi:hypothetical protein
VEGSVEVSSRIRRYDMNARLMRSAEYYDDSRVVQTDSLWVIRGGVKCAMRVKNLGVRCV